MGFVTAPIMLVGEQPGDSEDKAGVPFVDDALAKQGRARQIALTVPNFMMALAMLAETDLIAALPGKLVAMHGARFGVTSAKLPLPPRRDDICGIVSKAALGDAGWLGRSGCCEMRSPFPPMSEGSAGEWHRSCGAGAEDCFGQSSADRSLAVVPAISGIGRVAP